MVVVIQRISLEGEAASFIAVVAHTFPCMRAARHAMIDLRACATSGQTSSMARAQLLLALHCLILPSGEKIHMMYAADVRILLSEDVPFTNRCYTPRFREGTWSTIRGKCRLWL